ncbi:hypothetical protein H9X96_03190 [Pedobacter sp. N36a]|uniref:hypothetical protein n=1 Tax=Pedobacter sp. N36a TaxID=2767996 RepID=UPI001656A6EC|nr:hypothetical protein [Pedobacter sp. N36a]MBC8984775.1 hypothetical protein [Pedobacter sp. N36a]
MAPKKGTTNNPYGRPRGSKNKATENMKQAVKDLIDSNWKIIGDDIKKLSPKDRVAFIEKLVAYVLPKTTTIEGNMNNINYNVPLTDEEVKAYAKALEEEINI